MVSEAAARPCEQKGPRQSPERSSLQAVEGELAKGTEAGEQPAVGKGAAVSPAAGSGLKSAFGFSGSQPVPSVGCDFRPMCQSPAKDTWGWRKLQIASWRDQSCGSASLLKCLVWFLRKQRRQG